MFPSCGHSIPVLGSGVKAKPFQGRFASLDSASRLGFLAPTRKTHNQTCTEDIDLVGTNARCLSLVHIRTECEMGHFPQPLPKIRHRAEKALGVDSIKIDTDRRSFEATAPELKKRAHQER